MLDVMGQCGLNAHMNPIYALWSHPRSMSTAMERIMRERGDLDCAHEPFMYDYYVHRAVRVMPHFEVDPDHPQDYAGIRDMLLNRAEAGPVFFKDMSYYVMPHLLRDRAFCDRIIHMFLIRDPEAAILSYSRIDDAVTSEEIGLEAQWRHVEGLRAQGRDVVVIKAEDVRANPEMMMKKLWQRVDLPFLAHAFNWSKERPKDWEQVGGWHGDVSGAHGIKPLSEAEIIEQKQKFKAAADAKPKLRELLEQHRPFYDRLAALAID